LRIFSIRWRTRTIAADRPNSTSSGGNSAPASPLPFFAADRITAQQISPIGRLHLARHKPLSEILAVSAHRPSSAFLYTIDNTVFISSVE
jgi:hypothetical protein